MTCCRPETRSLRALWIYPWLCPWEPEELEAAGLAVLLDSDPDPDPDPESEVDEVLDEDEDEDDESVDVEGVVELEAPRLSFL